MTFIKRADLGRPLTWDELDSNFEQVDSYAAAASASAGAAQTQAQSASQSASQALQSQQAAEAAAASAEGAVDDFKTELASPTGVGLIGGAWIIPEMFYSGTGPHSTAVQLAFDRSNTTGEQVYMGGQYLFDVPVTVKNGVNVISGQRASISPYPGSNNGTAFIFDAGNSNRKFNLPAVSGFNQIGIPVAEVKCDLAHIYFRQAVNCHTLFKTVCDSENNSILDVIMEFNTVSGCEVGWEMYCGSSTNVVQGCVLKGNFLTDTTRCFKRTGVASPTDGNMVDILSVDFTPRCAGGAFIDNQVSGYQMPRFTARVPLWFGGDGFALTGANAVRIVTGQFVGGLLELSKTRDFLPESLLPNQWRSGKVLITDTTPTIGQVKDMPVTPGLAGFNGGVMLSGAEVVVRLTLTSDLAAGAQAVGYFYNIFADGSYQRWDGVPIEGNTRLMLASIKDQSSTEAGRVEVAVRNTSGATVVTGQNVIFRISRR